MRIVPPVPGLLLVLDRDRAGDADVFPAFPRRMRLLPAAQPVLSRSPAQRVLRRDSIAPAAHPSPDGHANRFTYLPF